MSHFSKKFIVPSSAGPRYCVYPRYNHISDALILFMMSLSSIHVSQPHKRINHIFANVSRSFKFSELFYSRGLNFFKCVSSLFSKASDFIRRVYRLSEPVFQVHEAGHFIQRFPIVSYTLWKNKIQNNCNGHLAVPQICVPLSWLLGNRLSSVRVCKFLVFWLYHRI